MAVKFFVDETGKALPKKPKGQRVSAKPVARSMIEIPYANDMELLSWAGKGYTLIFDIESYWNYFLIGFKCLETGKFIEFEDSPDTQINLDKLNWIVWNFRLVGFNSIHYDMPMLFLALRGYRAQRLKECTNILIPAEYDFNHRVDLKQTFNLTIPPGIDHIDLFNVCPLKGTLKKRAARLHAKRLQDLPFDPHKVLTFDEAQHLKNYCLGSDIPATELIFNELSEQIRLRYDLSDKYAIDLRSKSDAQIAEAVIREEVKRKTGRKLKKAEFEPGSGFQYKPPAYLNFQHVGMQEVFKAAQEMYFEITEEGKLSMPEQLSNMEVRIGKTVYKLGKGGLHSKEKCASYKAENGMLLLDIDAESFYPRLILNSGLYPEAIGPIFLEIFEEIVNHRLDSKASAKRIKEQLKQIEDKLNEKYKTLNLQLESYQAEADGLKITINGTFGKLGSRWSIMFAPNLLIQVTLTGQLSLLMLIARMEAADLQVVSANTDGIVLYIHESRYADLCAIKDQWCKEASLKMEETRYKALYSRDVNNYIAVKMDGKVKLKGAYSNPWNDKDLAIFRFHKNPMTTICIEAVSEILTTGKPVESTIRECTDITKFTCAKDVAGGAHKNGIFLGKTARWYYAQDERDAIHYVSNGNTVGESDGAKPLMDLPDEFPQDIDYAAYVEKANGMLYDIGFYQRPKSLELFN